MESRSDYVNRGNLLENDRKYDAALICYDHEITQGYQDVFGAALAKLSLLKKLKRYEEMLATCDQLIKLRNYDEFFYRKKGEILKSYFQERNEHEKILIKSLEMSQQEIIKNPAEPLYYQNKAKTLFLLERFDECFKELDLALEFCVNDEEKASVYYDKADFYEKWYEQTTDVEKLKLALRYYKEAHRFGDDNSTNIRYIENILDDMKQMEMLNRKLSQNPQDYESYIKKANLLSDINEIFSLYDRAVKVVKDPKGLGRLYSSRAYYEFFRNEKHPLRYDRAMEAERKAIKHYNQARNGANGFLEKDRIDESKSLVYDSMGTYASIVADEREDRDLYELAIDYYEQANYFGKTEYERLQKIHALEEKLGYGLIFNRRPEKKKGIFEEGYYEGQPQKSSNNTNVNTKSSTVTKEKMDTKAVEATAEVSSHWINQENKYGFKWYDYSSASDVFFDVSKVDKDKSTDSVLIKGVVNKGKIKSGDLLETQYFTQLTVLKIIRNMPSPYAKEGEQVILECRGDLEDEEIRFIFRMDDSSTIKKAVLEKKRLEKVQASHKIDSAQNGNKVENKTVSHSIPNTVVNKSPKEDLLKAKVMAENIFNKYRDEVDELKKALQQTESDIAELGKLRIYWQERLFNQFFSVYRKVENIDFNPIVRWEINNEIMENMYRFYYSVKQSLSSSSIPNLLTRSGAKGLGMNSGDIIQYLSNHYPLEKYSIEITKAVSKIEFSGLRDPLLEAKEYEDKMKAVIQKIKTKIRIVRFIQWRAYEMISSLRYIGKILDESVMNMDKLISKHSRVLFFKVKDKVEYQKLSMDEKTQVIRTCVNAMLLSHLLKAELVNEIGVPSDASYQVLRQIDDLRNGTNIPHCPLGTFTIKDRDAFEVKLLTDDSFQLKIEDEEGIAIMKGNFHLKMNYIVLENPRLIEYRADDVNQEDYTEIMHGFFPFPLKITNDHQMTISSQSYFSDIRKLGV
jgi:tetratricopeptide (TPR) repeat protein